MKKMIVTLAIAISSFSAFANDENVNQKVLDAFNTEFTTAKEVEWSAGPDYYKATFNYNGKYVFAFYSENGELLGMTRYISPSDLPLSLQTNLKKNYEGYWVSDLFEVSKNEGTSYYITLENADAKIILNSAGTRWTVFTKSKKA
jgi:uncharacterized protein YegP (UPF0339 family)